MNDVVLQSMIQDEISGKDYTCSKEDRETLNIMLNEMNQKLNTNIHYLAEIDAFDIHGSGSIFIDYFDYFQSESVRAYLIPQLVSDRINNCSRIVYESYLRFKNSEDYIAKSETPDPAHIYVRYDNALKKLKPKELKSELVSLVSNPRDAYYLPFTTNMLASWKLPKMQKIVESYLLGDTITPISLGFTTGVIDNYYPQFETIKRGLIFVGIKGMKYYPESNYLHILKSYCESDDKDIALAARKIITHIQN